MERFPELESFLNAVDFLRARRGDCFLMEKRLEWVLSILSSLGIAVGIVKDF
jgi:hypothetical protein